MTWLRETKKEGIYISVSSLSQTVADFSMPVISYFSQSLNNRMKMKTIASGWHISSASMPEISRSQSFCI